MGAAAWIACSSSAAASTLFSDNFARTSGLGPSWHLWFGSYTTDGTAAVSGPSTPANDGNWASVVPSLGTDDYAVQADLTIPAGSSFSGIFARATGTPDILTGDLYDAQIASSGEVNLYKRHASTWTLFQSVPANIQANTPYTVRLVTTGAPTVHLEVWVNGTRRISFDDASGIPSGAPGIQNFDGDVKYANFAVEAAGALFSDNFARTTGLGQNWKVWWGSYTTDGTAAMSGPSTPAENGNWASVVPSLGTEDYAVQADVSIPAGSSFSGIFARATGTPDILTGDLYDAQIASSGQMNLYKRHASQWTLLQSIGASIQAGVPYTLRLVTTGSTLVHLEVWLNGTQLIAADDAAGIPAGVPGLENFDGNVRYAAFSVSSATATGGGTSGPPPGYVDVTKAPFNAVGDGVHDDTAAFQAATNTGNGVWVPRPSNFYLISGPILLKNSIAGDMSDLNNLPALRMAGADGFGTHVGLVIDGWPGTTQLKVLGLELDGGYTSGQTGEFDHNIAIRNSNNVLISNCRLLNAKGDGVCIGEWKRAPSGLPEQACQNITVLNSYIFNPMRAAVTPLFVSAGGLCQGNYLRKINHQDFGFNVPVIDIEPDEGPQNSHTWDYVIDGNVVDAHTSDGSVVDFVWQVTSMSFSPDPVHGTVISNNKGYWGSNGLVCPNGPPFTDTNNVFTPTPPSWVMQPYSGGF